MRQGLKKSNVYSPPNKSEIQDEEDPEMPELVSVGSDDGDTSASATGSYTADGCTGSVSPVLARAIIDHWLSTGYHLDMGDTGALGS